MVKCPFCQFENEDGALFCEQCKSDLGVFEPVASAEPVLAEPVLAEPVAAEPVAVESERAEPDAGAVPHATPALPETVALVSPVEEAPVVLAEAAPMAEPVFEAEAVPPMAETTVPVGETAASPPVVAEVAPPAVEVAAPPVAETVPAPAAPPAEPTAPPRVAPAAAPAARAAAQAQAPAAPAPVPAAGPTFPPGVQPKLVVLRGLKIGVEYPIYEGLNFIGRADEKPVDIDLDDQESPDRVWSSRQHALITFEEGQMVIEDLNSSNGTFVNRTRVWPGQKRPLSVGDVIQIGTVQMKVKA